MLHEDEIQMKFEGNRKALNNIYKPQQSTKVEYFFNKIRQHRLPFLFLNHGKVK
jgi:hypothetical protein